VINSVAADIVSGFGSAVEFVIGAGATIREALGQAFAGLVDIVLTPIRIILDGLLMIEDAVGLIPDSIADGIRSVRNFTDDFPQGVRDSTDEAAASIRGFGTDFKTTMDGTAQTLRENSALFDELNAKIQRGRMAGRFEQRREVQIGVRVEVGAESARKDLEKASDIVRARVREVLQPQIETVHEEQAILGAQAAIVTTP
jgi:hypothetical protein